jgi:hypothetical protein
MLDALGVHTTTNLRASPHGVCPTLLAVTNQERLPAIVLSQTTIKAPEEASRQLQVPL